MKKILISTGRDEGYYMIDPEDIETCEYWTGEERVYRYDEENDTMERLFEVFTDGTEGWRYFVQVIDGKPDDPCNFSNMDSKEIEKKIITYWEGCEEEYTEEYVEVTANVFHNNYKKVTLCYGINSRDIILSEPDGSCVEEIKEVDVEQVGSIPQEYPTQERTTIYEGTDEDGQRIRIEEVSPFFEDRDYPVCDISYI